MMMPICSLVVVVVQDAATGAAGDAPEPQLELVADDDAAAEARAIGLVENVVVEEVAVLVGRSS